MGLTPSLIAGAFAIRAAVKQKEEKEQREQELQELEAEEFGYNDIAMIGVYGLSALAVLGSALKLAL